MAPRKPLSLKRTVESGHVRQSFSHGRSKSVVVEKKKKRTISAPGDADSHLDEEHGGLSSGELDARRRALEASRERAETEAREAVEREAQRQREEATAKAAAETANADALAAAEAPPPSEPAPATAEAPPAQPAPSPPAEAAAAPVPVTKPEPVKGPSVVIPSFNARRAKLDVEPAEAEEEARGKKKGA
ncbi:MAG TPA: translation initiation factor IF-2 associated domain-containing protein, partial [Dehalococcoidia bacterium]|nr:translation initiation factor IF-2 associated domain-containing protein [Dehalococcoidia bacterium]